ncbi:BMP family lipoprotein [Halegenticoccus tardaugens]|uniref:BMP family lipoprotein n=1 Tax=Halegenticoccus tardaugens TaxID=2071624 RepID=UPI00100BE611|nr:BMP family protein [Halegenticoccus tardaugens]
MDRRTFLKGTGAAGVVGLAGCTGGPTEGGDGNGDGNSSDGGGGGSGSAEANVGVVYATGGLGDGSFNDQAKAGAERATDEFDVDYEEAQPSEVSEFANYQQQFAGSTNPEYDLICCIGYLQEDALSETAPDYEDRNFMLVDSAVEEPNVSSYVFGEEQGSFLVGHLAGLLTTREFEAGAGATQSDAANVGFVGGEEGSLIGKFEAGYRAGVARAGGDIEVQRTYVGSFNDPAGGKEAALAMYNDGADVIYHAAGNTGTGVFQAAQEAGRFAIGVDQDQSKTKSGYADVILASMVKRVDTAVYTSIENVVNGEFEGGSTTTLGLEQEGVSIEYGQELEGEISGDVKSEIEASQKAIVDGDVSVPSSPDEL